MNFTGSLREDGRERAVAVTVRDGVLRGTVDGKAIPEAAVERRGAEVRLSSGGVRARAVVARDGARLLVHLDGRVHEFELGDGTRKRAGGAGRRHVANDEPRVLSPMTGTVVQVPVKPGDAVAAGGTLAVVEAMKMQFVVRAPRAVVVKSVAVAPGAAVEIGAVLVEFEDSPAVPGAEPSSKPRQFPGDPPTGENAPR